MTRTLNERIRTAVAVLDHAAEVLAKSPTALSDKVDGWERLTDNDRVSADPNAPSHFCNDKLTGLITYEGKTVVMANMQDVVMASSRELQTGHKNLESLMLDVGITAGNPAWSVLFSPCLTGWSYGENHADGFECDLPASVASEFLTGLARRAELHIGKGSTLTLGDSMTDEVPEPQDEIADVLEMWTKATAKAMPSLDPELVPFAEKIERFVDEGMDVYAQAAEAERDKLANMPMDQRRREERARYGRW